jgi:hypothetical protein
LEVVLDRRTAGFLLFGLDFNVFFLLTGLYILGASSGTSGLRGPLVAHGDFGKIGQLVTIRFLWEASN